MSATEKDMKRLHGLLAQVYDAMLERELKGGEDHIPISASHLAAINAFLKNNEVTMIRDEGSAMDSLDQKLKEMEAKRRAAQQAAMVPPLSAKEIDDLDDRIIQ